MNDSRVDSFILLFAGIRFYPGPDLYTSTSFLRSIPGPSSPAFSIPSTRTKPQVKLFRPCMLQYLAQRSGYVLEVLLLKGLKGSVTFEVEGC